jgi:hypothetical protein
MKKIKLFFVFILFAKLIYAQTIDAKRDNIWVLGYGGEGPTKDTFYSNMIINFKEKPVDAKKLATEMNFNDDIAMISDTSGKLLFYTNGIYIADASHQPMKNGNNLNPGKTSANELKYGRILPQGSLILPKPDNPDLYYLFHASDVFVTDSISSDYKGDFLYYSLIDMAKNDGKGEVIEKNKILLGKYVDVGKVTATRHANGKDWWIIMADYDTTIFNTFLLTANGIEVKPKQKFEKSLEGGVGQAVFSPDGTKYARFNAVTVEVGTDVDIFDFDRCSGKLSNQKHWNYTSDTTWSGGIAISPNSKYLYVFSYSKIYQFDLQSDDVFSTLDTVAVWDKYIGTDSPYSSRFYLAQLAPDNKIYVTIPSTSTYYHVIENPDKKGKACNVKQRGFKLPTKNYTTIPNFPNFRLGKAASPCITSVNDEIEPNFKIYPNPNSGDFTLENEANKANNIIIYAIDGKAVYVQKISEGQNFISTNNLNNGIYFLQIKKDNRTIQTEKISILK